MLMALKATLHLFVSVKPLVKMSADMLLELVYSTSIFLQTSTFPVTISFNTAIYMLCVLCNYLMVGLRPDLMTRIIAWLSSWKTAG